MSGMSKLSKVETSGPSAHNFTSDNQHLKYRADIDGLRAIAIISVVLFHAFPGLLSGGFVGVDVFFVISGFLISSIIFKSLEAGSFSFVEFYKRRIRRIFPALIFVLVACYCFGWISSVATEFSSLGKHIAAGLGFVQNIILYRESGYFDVASELKPLLHLWSLGVEEQFYLLFPVAAIVVWRLKLDVYVSLAIMALLSFVLCVIELGTNASAAFYLPYNRVWEILCGSLLAYSSYKNHSVVSSVASFFSENAVAAAKLSPILPNVFSFVGLILLVGCFFFIDKTFAFPGYWAAIPVLGSVLLIASGPDSLINKRILSSRVMVWIGLISFPLYLWHWPILTFARTMESGTPSVKVLVICVFASVVAAWLTYRFVEKPFRSPAHIGTKSLGLLFVAAILGIVGFATYKNDGFTFRMKDREDFAQYFENAAPGMKYMTEHDLARRYRLDCDFFDLENYRHGRPTVDPRPEILSSCYTPTSNKSVMLWGDSHVQQLRYGIEKVLPKEVSILQVASSGCFPYVPGPETAANKVCDTSNILALDVIERVIPKVVIIAQFSGIDTKNDIKSVVAKLKAYGVERVIVMGPVPRYEVSLYQIVLRQYWLHTPRRISTNLTQEPFDEDASLKGKYSKGEGGFKYISVIDELCNVDGCLSYLGQDMKKGLVSFDYGHFNAATSLFVVNNLIASLMLEALGLPFQQETLKPEDMDVEIN